MTEETKKPRKPRAKKLNGIAANVVIIDEPMHALSTVKLKREEMRVIGSPNIHIQVEVPVVPNPGWDTPIYEILGHPKFDEMLKKEMKTCKEAEPKPGYHMHPYLQKVLDKYYFYPEKLKIEYVKMMNKECQEPSGMRTFMKQIVETSVFLTIKFYEKP